MKTFLKIMMDDYRADGFTGKDVAIGAIVSILMVGGCLLAEYVNGL